MPEEGEEILKEDGVEMPLTEVPEMMPEEEAPGFIYAIGSIQPRFPTLSVEKEFAQAAPEGKAANLTDPQVLYEILSQEENRYLAREVCWIFTVESIDTYILQPRQYRELLQLTEAIKPVKGIDVDVVIGIRGPTAPPEMCNGLQVPIVTCNRIYSFDIEEFITVIPKPKDMEEEPFKEAARELFFWIMQLADNVGATDEHRALNYVAVRYSAIYAHSMEMFVADKFLSRVEVQPSRLSGTRRIVDVIFTYINSKTNVIEKYFTRVDVTGQWPFLVSKLQPFYER